LNIFFGMGTDTQTQKRWQLIEVLREATAFLNAKGIENPRLDAERLMSHVLGISRIDLYLRFEQPLSQKERDACKEFLRRRARYEPLQYILGEAEFMSLPFKLTPAVLVPRPETEVLVEHIVNDVGKKERIRILDIGTGCGNIAISLAKYLNDAEVVGIDTSEDAMAVARQNARRNGVDHKTYFLLGDVKNDDFRHIIEPPFGLVVSNPPYVSNDDFEKLPAEIRDYEPKQALCDGGNGYSFFRLISQKGREILQKGGRLYFEMGDGQSRSVQAILEDFGYQDICIFSDLNGIERVISGVFKA
jgi:release factor glutamine methyltransferase